MITEKDQARFWAKVALPDEQGCMLWLSALSSAGYGRITMGGKTHYAHRISYALAYGAIPTELQLDHLCRVRHCVAPDHLEPVTGRVNVLRGQTPAAANAAKTHCPRDHAYDEENTYVDAKGRRNCRACARERARVYRRRVA